MLRTLDPALDLYTLGSVPYWGEGACVHADAQGAVGIPGAGWAGGGSRGGGGEAWIALPRGEGWRSEFLFGGRLRSGL